MPYLLLLGLLGTLTSFATSLRSRITTRYRQYFEREQAMSTFNWHETCRKPDVEFSAGLGVPTCSSCGCIATSEGLAEAQHHQAPLVPAPTTRFELRWPLSLPFVDDPSVVSNLPEKTIAESKDVRGNVTPLVGQPTTSNHEPATNSSILVEAPYEPLFARKIRLLKLLKGNYNDPVRVELQVADLTIKPEYEALSYTWADEKNDSSRCEKVYVGERWDILLVTKNCLNALRRLRYSYRSRRLWVDAICINQNDVGERSHQVGIMQNIYATASRVLIYLGEDEEDLNSTSSSPWNFDKWNTYYKRSLPAHKDLTQQQYFKRVWVIQEIAAAQDCWVLFGTRGDRWQDFLQRRDVKYCDRNINWLQMLPKGNLMDSEELPSLLHATALCEATDPRDKLFALFGLLQDAKQAQLDADYSLSKEQVFSGFTAYLFFQSPAFMLPIFAALQPELSDSYPSWAVDWSSGTALNLMRPLLPKTNLTARLEWGSGNYSIMPQIYRDGALVVKGRPVSHLSSCFLDHRCNDGPPGILGEVYHRPGTTQEALPVWAKSKDKLVQIKGLDSFLLVLRPTLKATKAYRHVAIVREPKFHSSTAYLDLIDRKAILLFSTWLHLLGTESDGRLWSLDMTWGTVKAVCHNIKNHWKLEEFKGRFLESFTMSEHKEQPTHDQEIQAAVRKLREESKQCYVPEWEASVAFSDHLEELEELMRSLSKTKDIGEVDIGDSGPLHFLGQCLRTTTKTYMEHPKVRKTLEQFLKKREVPGLRTIARFAWERAQWRERAPWQQLSKVAFASAMKLFWEDLERSKGSDNKDSDNLSEEFGVIFGSMKKKRRSVFDSLSDDMTEKADTISVNIKERDATIVPAKFTEIILSQNFDEIIGSTSDSESAIGRKFRHLRRANRVPWLQDSERHMRTTSMDLSGRDAFVLETKSPQIPGTDFLEEPDYPQETDFFQETDLLEDNDPLKDNDFLEDHGFLQEPNVLVKAWTAKFIQTCHAWSLEADDWPGRSRASEDVDLFRSETEGCQEEQVGYLAAAKSAWAPLLDLVRETETHMLPLERGFVGVRTTVNEEMAGVPWEDIRIV